MSAHAAAADDPLSPTTSALAAATLEILRHLDAGIMLDAPRWFALARTSHLLAEHPGLSALLGLDDTSSPAVDEHHLTSVELDHLEPATDVWAGLASLHWPDFASAGAVAMDLRADQWQAVNHGGEAPAHSGGVRVVVAADSSGESWGVLSCADSTASRMGPSLLPEISAALAESLRST